MEKQKHLTRSRWLFVCLLSLLMTLGGAGTAFGQVTEEFSGDEWPDEWSLGGEATASDYYLETDADLYSTPTPKRGVYGQVASGKTKYIITPVVNGNGNFKFKRRNSSNGSVYVYTIEDGVLSATAITSNTSKPTSWTTVSFTGVTNKRLAIVLNGRMDKFTYTAGVENPYKKPATLTISSITSNSAVVSWTAGSSDDSETGWDLEYKKASEDTWTEVHGLALATLSYSLTGLSDNTAYDVRVKAIYGENESDWKTDAFKTIIGSYPWTENFNGISSGIPAGWDNTEGTTTYDSYKWNYYSTGHEGKCVRFDSFYNSDGNTNMLKTPVMIFTQNTPMQLKFWYKNPAGGDFSVFISNDGGATYTEELASGLTGAAAWTEKVIDLPTDTYYDNVVIVFQGTSNRGSGDAYIYLDDVQVKEAISYAMTISGEDVSANTIAFGTVRNATTTKTFTINNEGSNTLTNISVVSSDASVFTVSDTDFDLAANSTKDITVTFVKGVVGDYDETITISQANVSNQVLNVTGSYTDTWGEDFESGVVPEGWTANGWTVTKSNYNNNGTYMFAAGYNTNTMYSPRLYAEKDQELTFYVGGADATDYQTVKWANNRNTAEEDWTLIGEFTTEGNQTFTAPATGYYYLSFQGRYTSVDNFNGFKYAPLEHDVAITAQSIPSTGNEGVEYTATVTVEEMAGKAEELTAKFFIGSTQYGADAVETVEASGTKTFTVTFTPEGAISGNAHFTITNSNIDLTSDNVAVTISAAPELDETVGSLAAFENWGNYPIVKLNYSLKAGWNTIILPFAVNDITIFGANAKAYAFSGYNEPSIAFSKVTSLNAQTPYILYTDEAKSTITFTGVTNFRTSEDAADLRTTNGGAIFQGTYAPIAAGDWQAGWYGVTTEGKIAPGSTSTSTMKGFRAYFTGITTGARLSFYDDATGITTIIDAKELNNDAKAYNLNGQQVKNAHKGLYIVNGRKVVVK